MWNVESVAAYFQSHTLLGQSQAVIPCAVLPINKTVIVPVLHVQSAAYASRRVSAGTIKHIID